MNCSVYEGKVLIIERCARKGRGESTDLGEQERRRLSKAKTKSCELLAFAAKWVIMPAKVRGVSIS
jgi:hypothetical protein